MEYRGWSDGVPHHPVTHPLIYPSTPHLSPTIDNIWRLSALSLCSLSQLVQRSILQLALDNMLLNFLGVMEKPQPINSRISSVKTL